MNWEQWYKTRYYYMKDWWIGRLFHFCLWWNVVLSIILSILLSKILFDSTTYCFISTNYSIAGTSARIDNVSPADTGCSMESPAPDQHDPHSSEEELEVINNSKQARSRRPPRAASVSLPEKRKWSQVRNNIHFK